MMESLATVHYMSSSMRSIVEDHRGTSPFVSPNLPSVITLDSISVDPLSSYSSITPCDDVHVNLSTHDDESGSFTMSGGLSSTSNPIFYYDDNIMEVFTTPNFIYSPLHRNHAFKTHTSCGHYIDTQFFGKGAPILESRGEAILQNPHSESGSVDSSTIILPHLEEPLEFHITSDRSRDDPLHHFFILH